MCGLATIIPCVSPSCSWCICNWWSLPSTIWNGFTADNSFNGFVWKCGTSKIHWLIMISLSTCHFFGYARFQTKPNDLKNQGFLRWLWCLWHIRWSISAQEGLVEVCRYVLFVQLDVFAPLLFWCTPAGRQKNSYPNFSAASISALQCYGQSGRWGSVVRQSGS